MLKTIVFVNSIPAGQFGGGERWCCRMAGALKRQGYRIGLVARPASQLVRAFQDVTDLVMELKFGADFNPVSILRLRRFFRAISARVLILNFNKDVSIAGPAGRLAGVPKIIFRNGYPLLRPRLRHRLLVSCCDVLVCNCRHLARYYRSFGWGLNGKIKVIYNGLPSFAAARSGEPGGPGRPVVVLGAGRLVRVKRFDLFVDIIARLQDSLPVLGILAGAGPEMAALQEQVWRQKAPVLFTGQVESLAPWFQQAALLLHTSRNEGLPNVVMEAMAAGVPVVATDAGGTRELVRNGETGFLCPVNDREMLFRRTRQLALDPGLRGRCAARSRAVVEKRFTLVESLAQWENLINN